MENYENLGTIGEGTYGIVMKARHKETGQLVAIKKFKESDEDEQVRKTALREVRILKKLKHENIVNLIEVFRRKGKLYLVFEYIDNTMLGELEKHPYGLDELGVKKCAYQLLKGIEYCHAHNIIHRDIKPENLLISKSGALKLCDFGFARTLVGPGAKYTDYVATRWYRSPELLVGDTEYGKPVDIWAIGCMLAEILNGIPLFPGESDIDQLFHIVRCFGRLTDRQMEIFSKNPLYYGIKIPFPTDLETLESRFPELPPKTLSLLKACLHYEPEQRCSCTELLQHPFFEGFEEWFNKEMRGIIEKESALAMRKKVKKREKERDKRERDREEHESDDEKSSNPDTNNSHNNNGNNNSSNNVNANIVPHLHLRQNTDEDATRYSSPHTSTGGGGGGNNTGNRSAGSNNMTMSMTSSNSVIDIDEEEYSDDGHFPDVVRKQQTPRTKLALPQIAMDDDGRARNIKLVIPPLNEQIPQSQYGNAAQYYNNNNTRKSYEQFSTFPNLHETGMKLKPQKKRTHHGQKGEKKKGSNNNLMNCNGNNNNNSNNINGAKHSNASNNNNNNINNINNNSSSNMLQQNTSQSDMIMSPPVATPTAAPSSSSVAAFQQLKEATVMYNSKNNGFPYNSTAGVTGVAYGKFAKRY